MLDGADANYTWGEDNESPLCHPCFFRHYKIVSYLLTSDSHSAKNIEYLYIAFYFGHIKVVKVPLEHGVSVDSNEKVGYSLWIASYYGHGEIVLILLESGADYILKSNLNEEELTVI